MRRIVRIVIVIAVLWVAYLVWPFFALYGLVGAVEARNPRAVMERVNVSAIRLSFIDQIFRTYIRLSGREAMAEPLPGPRNSGNLIGGRSDRESGAADDGRPV